MAGNASHQLRSQSAVAPDMRVSLGRCSCAVALDGRLGQTYNEEGFRYFLEIERKRAELSNRPLLLLLVDLKTDPGMDDRVSPATAARLFSGLTDCLRETDFVGWYREERTAAAVLTQRADAPRGDVATDVGQRVTATLSLGLPADESRRLQVRVFQLPPRREDSRLEE